LLRADLDLDAVSPSARERRCAKSRRPRRVSLVKRSTRMRARVTSSRIPTNSRVFSNRVLRLSATRAWRAPWRSTTRHGANSNAPKVY
jgi:hypothetical protein